MCRNFARNIVSLDRLLPSRISTLGRSLALPARKAGSIINRDEEMEMRRPERRALITEAVVNAVIGFCAQRSRTSEATAVKRQAKPKAKKQSAKKQ